MPSLLRAFVSIYRSVPRSACRRTTEDVLQQLMQGLIYPAVLGSVIYSAIEPVTAAVRAAFALGRSASPDWVLCAKLLLLAATIAFYFCDYMYILFTRHYRVSYFWLDIVFTATLYVTTGAIALDRGSEVPPNVVAIALCYLIFIALYLKWDWPERTNLENRGGESELYRLVVVWEITAAAMLVVVLLIYRFSTETVATIALMIAVTLITTLFAWLAWAKRLYSNWGPAELASTLA